jgi:hypothetical protein
MLVSVRVYHMFKTGLKLCRVLSTLLTHCSPVKFVSALLTATTIHKGPKIRCKIAANLDSSLQGERGQRIAGGCCCAFSTV